MMNVGQWRRGCWRVADPLLQQPNMKDVMELGTMRELKTNSNIVDELFDTVGPEEPRLKFAFDRRWQGGNWTMSKTEQYPVAHYVGDLAVFLVVVALLDSLCLLQPEPYISQELFPFFHRLGHRCHASVPRFIGPDGRRIPPIDHPKGRFTEGRLVGSVVRVLGPW
jgi:hypothetical protein